MSTVYPNLVALHYGHFPVMNPIIYKSEVGLRSMSLQNRLHNNFTGISPSLRKSTIVLQHILYMWQKIEGMSSLYAMIIQEESTG